MTTIKGWVQPAAFAMLCFAATLDPQTAAAATQASFFVAPAGSDTNPGTLALPFKTLERARQAVQPLAANMTGDIIVNLRGGTYALAAPVRFGSADSGSNGFTVIYRSYPAEVAVISGGTRISGWTRRSPGNAGDPVWMASVPSTLDSRSLYVDGVRAQATRIDGQGLAYCPPTCPPTAAAPTLRWVKNAAGYITDNNPPLATYKNPRQIEFVYTRGGNNLAWTESRCRVDSVAGNVVTMQGWGPTNAAKGCWNGVKGYLTQPTAIENVYEALHAPGEWYLDRSGATRTPAASTLYYIPRAGQDMASAEAIVPVLESLIVVEGVPANKVRNLSFRNLSFEHTTYLQPNGYIGFAESQANILHVFTGTNWKVPGAVVLRAVDNVTVLRNTFTRLGGAGLNAEYALWNLLIRGNIFSDISGNGLQLGEVNEWNPGDANRINDQVTIVNNYVHDIGVEYHGAVGMLIAYARNLLVAYNQLENLPYSGISIGWGWGNQDPNYAENIDISHNLIFNGMQTLVDGGCIYTLGALGTPQVPALIHDNVCHDFEQFPGGLYADQGSRYINFADNVIYGNSHTDTRGGYNRSTNAFFHYWIDSITLKHSFMDAGSCCAYADAVTFEANTGADLPTLDPVAIQSPYTPAAIADTTMFPASIVNAAGLQPAYQDLLPPAPAPTDTTPPAAPVGLAVSASSDSAVLSWSLQAGQTDVTGFEVRETSPENVVIAASKTTSVTIGARPGNAPLAAGQLLPNTAYTVVVRARDAAGNLSAASTPLTFTTPPQP